MAQAGRKGAVTVSTNMAGRGTDILLGGNAEFLLATRPGGWDSIRNRCLAKTGKTDAENEDPDGARARRSSRMRADFVLSLRSGTNPGESTISSAAVPDVRATPARLDSFFPCRTICCVFLGANGFRG